MGKTKEKKSNEDRYIKLCMKYYNCSSCPRNRECEEELAKNQKSNEKKT